MTKRTTAARIWAQLEKRLIAYCGLPNGRALDVNRPYLIRCIGDRLKATPVETRADVVEQVSALAGRDLDGGILPPPPDLKIDRARAPWWRSDTVHDSVLAAMLDRSCSRRMGYDGDDTVSYK